MWQALTQDVSTVCKEIMEKQIPEKQTYMSLPRPGVSRLPLFMGYNIKDIFGSNIVEFFVLIFTQKHGTTTKPLKSVRLDLSVSNGNHVQYILDKKNNNYNTPFPTMVIRSIMTTAITRALCHSR